MTFSRLLIGLIGIPLGIIIIRYRVNIKNWTGDIGWAEKYLGVGGTWTVIVAFGILVSFGSLMWMMGTLQELFIKYLGPFFGG